MSTVPEHPKIYHITHVDNLSQIIKCGLIWSDAQRIVRDADSTNVGMSHIKKRRLEKLEVKCYPNTKVGDYVPFYFCPRSIMLYILHMSNHRDLAYQGGQQPIVHLQVDMQTAIEWAVSNKRLWTFTNRNAGSKIAKFFNCLDNLNEVDWKAVAATDFRDPIVNEGKQAEFLIHESVPWTLVEKIGAADTEIKTKVEETLGLANKPLVNVEPSWYY